MNESSKRVAVITGAGSGVGRAAAVRLAKDFSVLVLMGRNKDNLQETAKLVGAEPNAAECEIESCDISDGDAVEAVIGRTVAKHGRIDVLVNSAGTNVRVRSLAECSVADYEQVVATNLTGAFLLARACLPIMRKQGGGAIINVISDAGLRANQVAGIAYVSAKFGLRGLTEAINAEERHNMIRATAVYPGEINTPLLEKRPVIPPVEARQLMLQSEDVAECIALAVALPARALVEEIVIRPTTTYAAAAEAAATAAGKKA